MHGRTRSAGSPAHHDVASVHRSDVPTRSRRRHSRSTGSLARRFDGPTRRRRTLAIRPPPECSIDGPVRGSNNGPRGRHPRGTGGRARRSANLHPRHRPSDLPVPRAATLRDDPYGMTAQGGSSNTRRSLDARDVVTLIRTSLTCAIASPPWGPSRLSVIGGRGRRQPPGAGLPTLARPDRGRSVRRCSEMSRLGAIEVRATALSGHGRFPDPVREVRALQQQRQTLASRVRGLPAELV